MAEVHLLVLLAGTAVSFAVSGLVRRTAIGRGLVVPPRPDRWHSVPTPTFGGIGIMTGLAAGLAISGGHSPDVWPVLAAGAALFGVGWYDDVAPMSALAKMVSSLAVAAFFVLTVGTFTGDPVHAALTLLAIVWFGGLDNAVNLLDNMDGLAAGVTAIAAAGLAVTFSQELGPALVTVLVALAGALLGFLGWNRHPAKLFMGNCGSLAVGGVIAACATLAIVRSGTVAGAVAAALILVVPLFDSTFVVLLRRLAGRSTTRGNIDHMSHRLVSAGFSEVKAVALLYAIGAAGASVAYLIHRSGDVTSPVAVAFVVGVVITGLYLARVPAYGGDEFRALQSGPFAPLLSDLTFRWHAGEVLLDLVLITACYYAAYRIRFEGEALTVFLSSFAISLPAIVGCQLAALYTSGLYSRSWSTFGLYDLSTVLRGVAAGLVLSVLTVTYLFKFERFSRSVFIIDAVLLTVAIIGTRVSFRMIARAAARSGPQKRRAAVYGAGALGQVLVREMQANPASEWKPVAFIDDDPGKLSRRVLGVPVRGALEDLDRLIRAVRIEEVIVSTPSVCEARTERVRAICRAHGIPMRRLHFEIQ